MIDRLAEIQKRLDAVKLGALKLVASDGDCYDFSIVAGAIEVAALTCASSVARLFAAAPDDLRYLLTAVRERDERIAALTSEIDRLRKTHHITD